jgi:DNA polymerase-3 subunit beta
MLFKIERNLFLDALSKTVPIAEKKSTLPILSHLLLDAYESKLSITATDLEVGLQIVYDCEVIEADRVTVPSKKVYEIVRELAAGLITVELGETGRVRLTSGESEFELASIDASDYPAWSSFEGIKMVALPSRKLINLIDKTIFASSSDDSRFNLNAVLFEQNGTETRLVATDGHRLALIDEEIGLALDAKVLVPKKSLHEVRRVVETVQDEISIGFEQKNMVIGTTNFTMTARLLEGDYPDYRKVIPQGGDNIIKLDRLRFMQTLKRVQVLTTDRNRGINVTVRPGRMELSASHPDLGTAKDSFGVNYDGEEFSIIINVAYLIESLGAVETEIISFEYLKEGAPITIRPDPPANYFNLVMPMRR